MNHDVRSLHDAASKVPAVTLLFWFIKIAATTLGETGGDAMSMSMDLGYLVSTAIFAAVFLGGRGHPDQGEALPSRRLLDHDHRHHDRRHDAGRFRRPLAGHRLRRRHRPAACASDVSLALWYRTLGSVSVERSLRRRRRRSTGSRSCSRRRWAPRSATGPQTPREWATQAAALVFGGLLAIVAVAYYRTRVSSTALFWAAFVLTRPLGAVLGDFLDKPFSHGGLASAASRPPPCCSA